MSNGALQYVATAAIGGTTSVIAGGKFANGAESAVFQKAVQDGLQAYEMARQQSGRVVPQGVDPNGNQTLYVNGVHGYLADFSDRVSNAGVGTFGYFLPPNGEVTDILRAIDEIVSSDGLSAGLSAALAYVDHPLNIIAYSEGTAVVYQAAMTGGLPPGSTLTFNSPIISYEQALAAQAAVGGPMNWNLPPGDIANLISGGANRWSGFQDLNPTCLVCIHGSTQYSH